MAQRVLDASKLVCPGKGCEQGTLLLQVSIAKNRIIDCNPRKVVVRLVIGIDESVRNVGYIVPSVAFTRDVDLAALDLKIVHPVLVESHKLLCKFHLIHDIRSPLGESYTHRLLNPKHVR